MIRTDSVYHQSAYQTATIKWQCVFEQDRYVTWAQQELKSLSTNYTSFWRQPCQPISCLVVQNKQPSLPRGCWENCKKVLGVTFLCCTLYSSWRPLGVTGTQLSVDLFTYWIISSLINWFIYSHDSEGRVAMLLTNVKDNNKEITKRTNKNKLVLRGNL